MKKREMTVGVEMAVCKNYLNCWWTSQKIKRSRIACTRTHSSRLRFGTSHEIGIKIEDAQYLYSFSKRTKLRSLLSNQNDKSLQKANLVFRLQPIKVLNERRELGKTYQEKEKIGVTQCLYSLRDQSEDQNYKSPVQKTHWGSAELFDDLEKTDHKRPQRG